MTWFGKGSVKADSGKPKLRGGGEFHLYLFFVVGFCPGSACAGVII